MGKNPLHVEFGDPSNDDVALEDDSWDSSGNKAKKRPYCLCCFSRRWHCVTFFLILFGALGFVLFPRDVTVKFNEDEWQKILHMDNNDFYFDRSNTPWKFVFDTKVPLEISNSNFIPLSADIVADFYYPPKEGERILVGSAGASIRVSPLETVTVWSELTAFSTTVLETAVIAAQVTDDCKGCLNIFQTCTDEATFFLDVRVEPKYLSESVMEAVVGEIVVPVQVGVGCDVLYK